MSAFNIKGDWSNTFSFLNRNKNVGKIVDQVLDSYAQKGVEALRASTPKFTSTTAESWGYKIEKKHNRTSIFWTNDNINDGVNIALILQYGHGTRNGGWVEGIDYINPALQSIFTEMADSLWREVTK